MNMRVSVAPSIKSPARQRAKRSAARRIILLSLFVTTVASLAWAQTTLLKNLMGADASIDGGDRERCLADLRAHNREYLNRTLIKFWGRQNYVEVLLTRMGEQAFARDFDAFADVGAGAYSASGGDVSLSFQYDLLFPAERKTILAFEPFKDSHDALLEQLDVHNRENRTDGGRGLRYILKNEGVGISGGPMEFRGSKNMMTANPRISGHPRWYGPKANSVVTQSTNIDAEMRRHGLDRLNVLKTDTEGLEWEVLLGARRALKHRGVDLLIIAYEDKWTWDSHSAVHPVPGSFVKDQLSLDEPNLKSVSTWLASMGYATYLLGLSPELLPDGTMRRGFAAIPVTGEYWDDDFEVCRDPKRYHKKRINCWMDAVAVLEGSAMQEWMEQFSSAHVRVSC